MKQINVGIIGTGWCGGIRADTCAASALVDELHIAEIDEARLAEVAAKTGAASATTDHRDVIANGAIDTIIISATPETTHYPMARDALMAGKHVFLEKPLALTLNEADELIRIQKSRGLKFAIGYSQRFNHKFAYARKHLQEGTIGDPVCALVSRHLTGASATRSAAASGCLPRPWRPPTISTFCSGSWSPRNRCGSIRNPPMAPCAASPAPRTPNGSW